MYNIFITHTHKTYSSDIEVVNSGTFEPFSEEMLLNAGLGLEDG